MADCVMEASTAISDFDVPVPSCRPPSHSGADVPPCVEPDGELIGGCLPTNPDLMRLFRRANHLEEASRDDSALATVLERIARLEEQETQRVDQAVASSGLGVSEESAHAIAVVVSMALMAKRDGQRKRAQKAGHQAAERSSGARERPRVIYASGVLAESYVIRDLLDPATWEFVTRPWRTVLDLPPHGTNGVGAADEHARGARALFGAEGPSIDPAVHVPWLAALADRTNDERFVAALMDPGLSRTEAEHLLAVIRKEVDNRVRQSRYPAEISLRLLSDIADVCRTQAREAWDLAVAEFLDEIDGEVEELDRLSHARYDEARAALWPYLYPTARTVPPDSGMVLVQEEVLPGLHAQLALHGRRLRWRPVTHGMLASWGVGDNRAWADATENISAATAHADPWPDPASPVQRMYVDDREAEWLGLLVHRRANACPIGYLVALPFRGSALIMPLDAAPPLPTVQALAALAADAYREAAQFDDHLFRQLLWLGPDGTPTTLCDLFEPPRDPSGLPREFLQAAASAEVRGGYA